MVLYYICTFNFFNTHSPLVSFAAVFGMSPRRLAVYPTYTTKKIDLVPLCLRRQNTRNKNMYFAYHRFKRSDDIFDTKTLNLADV